MNGIIALPMARRTLVPLTDAVTVVVCLLAGAAFAQLFRWGLEPARPDVSVLDIAFHNLGLALLAVAGTRYLAVPMIGFSALWLGVGLGASVAIRGGWATAALSLPHVPIEIAAWLATLRLAGLAWPAALAPFRADGSEPAELAGLARLAALTILIYLIGAVSEWAEITVHWPN